MKRLLLLLLLLASPCYGMQTGDLTSDTVMGGQMSVVYDSGELAAAATSVTISGLDGDNEVEYELIARIVNGATDTDFGLRPNNVSTNTVYGTQRVSGANASVEAAQSTTGFDWLPLGITQSPTAGNITFSHMKISAKSGYIRTTNLKCADWISGTTVTRISSQGQVWNNASDNITSLVVVASKSNGLGIGTRIILLRKNSQAVGMRVGNLDVQGTLKYAWQKIYSTTLTGDAANITITGLNGNSDVLYKIITRCVGNSAGGAGFCYRFGTSGGVDSGANYGQQQLYGVDAALNSSRDTGLTYCQIGYAAAVSDLSFGESLLYAKSGYARVFIHNYSGGISGATVTNTVVSGNVWNDTTNNLTQIYLYNNNPADLKTGTVIELYKLNL